MQNKNDKRIRLKKRIRTKIKGTHLCPRLTVFRSNKFIYAQVINDLTGKTLAQASDLPRSDKAQAGVKMTRATKTENAKAVGRMIAEICLKAKIHKVVFDRNGFKYASRIKLLADEARKSGLQF